jgi:hypothetical protein
MARALRTKTLGPSSNASNVYFFRFGKGAHKAARRASVIAIAIRQGE